MYLIPTLIDKNMKITMICYPYTHRWPMEWTVMSVTHRPCGRLCLLRLCFKRYLKVVVTRVGRTGITNYIYFNKC